MDKMQTRILAFIAVHVNRDLLREMQWLAIRRLEALQIGPKDVVGVARGNALGKFAMMVGVDLPFRLLVLGPPNLHGNAVHRAVVRPPNRAEYQCVRFVWLAMLGSDSSNRTEAQEKETREQEANQGKR